MKKILTGIIATVVLITTVAPNLIYGIASNTEITGKCGENATWTFNSSTGILTISGTGDMYTNYIPVDQWEYYSYRNDIKEVVVEEGITSIGGCAFGKFDPSGSADSEYPNLTKLTLSSSVKSIGVYAFYKAGLETISFSEGLERISEGAFRQTNLSGDLFLPQTLHHIDFLAFTITNITSVNLKEGMLIGGFAFTHCNYIKEVTIPKNLLFRCTPTSNAMRSNCAFAQCESLEKVIIKGVSTIVGLNQSDETIKNAIADGLFSYCESLKEIVIYSKDIEYVGANGSDGPTFDMTNNPTFYIYKDSTTEKTLREAGYLRDDNTVYIAEFLPLDEAIEEAEGMDLSNYTDESVSALNEALENGRAVLNDLTSSQEIVDSAVKAIKEAIKALEEKKEPSSSEPTSDEPSSDNSTEPTSKDPTTSPTNTPNVTTKPNNSIAQAKANAEKIMNQAKITKLKVKSKVKKKIVVSWKKVNKAVGYEVQVAKNNKFKKNKIVFDKFTKKKKLIFKNKIKSGTTYYVRVRAYATYKDENNKARKVYSRWIKKVRKVKVR